MNISDLKHFISGDVKGTFVLVLQDGAIITAEDRAMLQALYSRSPASVLVHLQKLAESGSGKFMDQFYVEYNHKSIGDCGDTTIFIENVSMLVAKAIQDWALYNGQEVSTRYVDFATQPFIVPKGGPEDHPQEKLRQFYLDALPVLKQELKERYPRNDDEKESVYDKAIAARAFDILRGFLPAGAQTNLAWTSNLRQVADKLAWLRVHPLSEVRDVARLIEEAVMKAHPNSFGHKRYEASELYRGKCMERDYYFAPMYWKEEVILTRNSLNPNLMLEHSESIKTRPAKTELPKHLAEIGTLQFEFAIDFGSYRDIQRQRAVIQRMPLLTTKYGFHNWYLDQLGDSLKETAAKLLMEVRHWWEHKVLHKEDQKILQYFLPMGFLVACRLTGDLPALLYLVELRAGSTVHPTLREIAQNMGKAIALLDVPVYIDESDSGRFDVKRGTQDIVKRAQ